MNDTFAQGARGDEKKQTVKAVEAAVAGLKVDTARVEGDRQHFVSSLADAMNEISHLTSKYKGFEQWEGEEEDDEGDDLSK